MLHQGSYINLVGRMALEGNGPYHGGAFGGGVMLYAFYPSAMNSGGKHGLMPITRQIALRPASVAKGGGQPLSTLEQLAKQGVMVVEVQCYHPYTATFDLEAYLVRTSGAGMNVHHVAMPVSMMSNCPASQAFII